MRHALEVAHERTATRIRLEAQGEGLAGLRTALLDVMPLNPDAVAMNRVWVSFWDAALGDEELGKAEIARYERWRGMLRPHVEAAVRLGEMSADAEVDDVVATAAGFAHGVVVQALFDPERFPPARQVKLVDDFVDGLRV